MNEIMKNILTRRSIRGFQEKEIPKEELEQIVQAGLYAPSGHNYQTWKFTVVDQQRGNTEACRNDRKEAEKRTLRHVSAPGTFDTFQ